MTPRTLTELQQLQIELRANAERANAAVDASREHRAYLRELIERHQRAEYASRDANNRKGREQS